VLNIAWWDWRNKRNTICDRVHSSRTGQTTAVGLAKVFDGNNKEINQDMLVESSRNFIQPPHHARDYYCSR
jgi:hypothetical protein